MKTKNGIKLYKYAKTIIPGGTTLFSKRSELHLPDKWPAYFIKAKKKTDVQLMGEDFSEKINIYRETFPNKRLPSGKPARVNVKVLAESFRWFFETYDYEWANVIKATKMYVNEYRDAEYMYMQTSQYFICKQDKHRVKHSTLADYCDMILEGVSTEDEHFKENVV